jgi:hypothetical protein
MFENAGNTSAGLARAICTNKKKQKDDAINPNYCITIFNGLVCYGLAWPGLAWVDLGLA